jgi:hypothetical protein
MFVGDGCRVYSEKHPNRRTANEVSVTRYTPLPCMIKLAPAQFHSIFSFFYGLENFCRRFQVPSTLFFIQKFLLY